jgi:hypothetical protein
MNPDQTRMLGGAAGIAEPHQNVGDVEKGFGASDADRLDLVGGLAQTRGVGQQNGYAGDCQGDFDLVARGPRNRGNNCFVFSRYHIDKARFSGVRRARDNDPDTVLQRFDAGPRQPFCEHGRKPGATARQLWIGPERIFVIIVDRALRPSRKFEQPVLPFPDLLAQSAFGERERGLALRFGLGLDQIGEALGLGEVNSSVLECTAGELAWFSKPQALDLGQRAEQCINHRAPAMTLKFNAIFARRACRGIEPQD